MTDAMNADATPLDTDADTPSPPRPRWAPFAIAAFVALVICTNVANASWAAWVDDAPARLLAFSSRQRYLVFTAASGIGVLPYAVIAGLRLAAAFVVCHLIGRAYRDDVLRIFTRYLGLTPETIDAYHKGLDKAEIAIIPLFVGSNIVGALTGIRQTPPRRLAALLAIGIAGRLALMWWLAKAFEGPVTDFLGWVDRYDRWVIGASIALVVLVNLRNVRRGTR